MSISTLHNIIDQMMYITVNHLQVKFIRWPDAEKRGAIAQSFVTKNNFPDIIGAIDGSHIPIIAPNEYHENFINRKSFHSIVLQVVCDGRMIFLDIVVGWPGVGWQVVCVEMMIFRDIVVGWPGVGWQVVCVEMMIFLDIVVGWPGVGWQVVCVERMIFLDIVVGWPGSVHDARVLRTSSL